MSDTPVGGRSAPPWLSALLALLASAAIGGYVAIALLRLGHPFELEWMEGAMLEHVARVVAGESLYVAPSPEFVPFIYPPLYTWTAAALAEVVGVGFTALRLVSLLASLGVLALAFVVVRRETGSRLAGLVAAGVFAATFRRGDDWLDLGRVDSLFLAWVALAVFLLRSRDSLRGDVLAGAALALAFLTKQTALVIWAPLALHALLLRRGARRFALAGSFALVAGSAAAWLQGASDGWFGYYVFELPARHEWDPSALTGFWLRDLGVVLAPAVLCSLLALRDLARRGDAAFWASLAVGCLGASWSSRLHVGGHDNVLLPTFLFLALGVGLYVGRAPGVAARALAVLALALLAYDPRSSLPTAADAQAGRALAQRLESVDGKVWVVAHGRFPGADGGAHQMAVFDVLRRSADDPAARALESAVREELRAGRWAAIVVDADWRFEGELAERYGPPQPLLADTDAFWPVAGVRTRPRRLWLRND